MKRVRKIQSTKNKVPRSKQQHKNKYNIIKKVLLIVLSVILILAIMERIKDYYIHISGKAHKTNVRKTR